MDFKLFPNASPETPTPYIPGPGKAQYSRYLNKSKNKTKTIQCRNSSIECVVGKRVVVDRNWGRKREELIKKIRGSAKISREFENYIVSTVVYPTFSESLHESLQKAIIRQLIRAMHAKRLIGTLIKETAEKEQKLYEFPPPKRILEIGAERLKLLGFGLKVARILQIANSMQSGSETVKQKGVGPWTQRIVEMDMNRDYRLYPFDDMSVDRIEEATGLNIKDDRLRENDIRATAYVYGASFLETQR